MDIEKDLHKAELIFDSIEEMAKNFSIDDLTTKKSKESNQEKQTHNFDTQDLDLNLSKDNNESFFNSIDTYPLNLSIQEKTSISSFEENLFNENDDAIEKLSIAELDFLAKKVEKPSEEISSTLNEKAVSENLEEEYPIDTLSSNEMSLLAEKFANLPEINILALEVDEIKMTLVETFDGLKISKVLPPAPELSDYKPNFVLSETNKIDDHLPELKEGESFARKFDLYESGMFLGITIGKSTKVDVIRIMREFGSQIFKPKETDKIKSYFAKDLSLAVSFDKNGIVNEITLGNEFKGQTSKGLRIGDHIKRMFEIYGKADVITPISLSWGNFVVFHKHDKVTHLRVKAVQ